MGCSDSKEKTAAVDANKAPPKPKPVEKPKEVKPKTPQEPAPPAPTAADLRARNIKDKLQCLGRCTIQGGEVTPEGLVYRIEKDGVIYYYNDTIIYEAHVEYEFGPGSDVHPGERVVMSEGENGGFKASCVVYPLETVEFASGTFNGVKVRATLEPLSEEYLENEVRKVNEVANEEQRRVELAAGGEGDMEQVLAKCLQNGVGFVDLDFPPHYRSLCRSDVDNRKMPEMAFMRPTQYLRNDLKDQSDDIVGPVVAASIDRGYLGDCWVSCAAAVIASNESLVKMIFSYGNPKEKKAGAYRVLLRKNGWFEKLILDNYLPTVGRAPAFAAIIDDPRELWMSLFEKAYAKVNGSFAAITGGDALHVLQDYIGATVYRFDNEWKEAAGDASKAKTLGFKLHEMRNSNHIVVFNTPNAKSGPSEKHEKLGLRLGFTYLVDRIEAVNSTVLFHVINPWGLNNKWTGAWGQDSSEWKANIDAKLKCKPSWNKPGEFWMSWNDAINYFDGGGVVLNNEVNFMYSVRGMFQNLHPTAVLEVTATEAVEVTLTLTQRDKRGIAIYEPDALQGAIMLSVSEEVNSKKQRVVKNTSANPMEPTTSDEFNFVADRAVTMNHTFEPGKPYFVIPRLHSGCVEEQHQREYVVTIGSAKSLEGKLNVEVKHIPRESRVFRNLVSFDDAGITNIEAEQQVVERYNPVTRVSSVLIAA